MAAIEVKLIHGLSRVPAPQRVVVRGLGLKKTNSTKVLPDTPATMGMIAKVAYLIEWKKVDAEPPRRRAPRKKRAKQA
jgi:large subunit ribosomal protein L30